MNEEEFYELVKGHEKTIKALAKLEDYEEENE